jgi:hypothetical protein
MTNKRSGKGKGKGGGARPRPPGGYREPVAPAEPKRGLLSGFLAPRGPANPQMPKILASVWRGIVTVIASPWLIVSIPVVVILEWLGAIALGFEGPFAIFANVLAIPPVGTSFDGSVSSALFGAQGGLYALLAFVAIRAVVMAFLVAMVVDVLDRGRVGGPTAMLGVRVIPVTLAVGIINMFLLTAVGILSSIFGAGGLGLLLQIAALVAVLYLFVFAPIMAAAERRSMPDSLTRSIRAARTPGNGNLLMATVYALAATVVFVISARPQAGVNPSIGAWTFVLAVNALHVAFLAAFAFRYLSISEEVPEAPPPRERAPRAR